MATKIGDRLFETKCEHCGDTVTVDLSNDPGADAYSVEAYDNYCGWNCRSEHQ